MSDQLLHLPDHLKIQRLHVLTSKKLICEYFVLLSVMAQSCTPIPPDPGYESTCGFQFHGNSARAAAR